MGFISIALRAIVNLESLSGVETVGNLARHRTAPIVLPQPDGYTVRFLPVISGESIAHAYQDLVAEEAEIRKLPLGIYSQRREFLKFTDEELLKKEGITPPSDEEDIRRAEVDVLLKDLVSDIGGFLYAGTTPIKRTSCFQVGYGIPAIHEKEAAALESQFHVRFAPSDPKTYQIPYSVEVGSAVYTFTFNIDLDRVGVPSTQFGDRDEEKEARLLASRPQRIQAALAALVKFYSYLSFGAKRSRFLPNMEPVSAVATYSKNVKFIVSPGNDKSFIFMSDKRRAALVEALSQMGGDRPEVKLFIYDREEASRETGLTTYPTLEDMLKALSKEIKI
jgi:CRISPR-associated protein Csa2